MTQDAAPPRPPCPCESPGPPKPPNASREAFSSPFRLAAEPGIRITACPGFTATVSSTMAPKPPRPPGDPAPEPPSAPDPPTRCTCSEVTPAGTTQSRYPSAAMRPTWPGFRMGYPLRRGLRCRGRTPRQSWGGRAPRACDGRLALVSIIVLSGFSAIRTLQIDYENSRENDKEKRWCAPVDAEGGAGTPTFIEVTGAGESNGHYSGVNDCCGRPAPTAPPARR